MTARPSACALLAQLAAGQRSARELTAETIAAIRAADAHVHAVVDLDERAALDAADAADAARRAGDQRPLLGLPVTVKDSLDVAGRRTAAGSLARVDHRAQCDATVVARVRAAGAVIVAKTNVPECSSSFETDNVIFGRTDHPLELGRTPGGSSGGEAALLAADASIVGIGSDGGGSIRVPAHYTGIVGLRPTTGRTPETGVWPPTRAAGTLDFTCVGPLARYVEDLELLLGVIAGADGIDPYAVDVALRRSDEHARRRLRVGFYDDHPRVPHTTPGTRAAVRAAAAGLGEAGHEVVEIAPSDDGGDPGGPSATELFFAAAGADGGAGVRAAVAAAHGRHHPQFAALIAPRPGPAPTAAEYLETVRRIYAYRARAREAIGRHDVVISPVVAGPAPRHGEAPAGIPAADYLRYESFEYVHVNALAGVPCASVPVAVEDGLPVGVQIAAAPFREDLVLAAAAELERVTGGFAINRSLAARASVDIATG